MTLEQRIRTRRKELDFTQDALAKALGVTPQHISAIEQDKRTPSLESLVKIAKELGVGVLDVELAGELKELFFGDHIVLKEGLPETERRQLLAHALCHQLMHAGNHFVKKESGYSYGNYQEKQADVFAAYFLMPESKLEQLADNNLTADSMSEKFDVDLDFALFRIELAKNSKPEKYSALVENKE